MKELHKWLLLYIKEGLLMRELQFGEEECVFISVTSLQLLKPAVSGNPFTPAVHLSKSPVRSCIKWTACGNLFREVVHLTQPPVEMHHLHWRFA
jgi:hypothetical protein